MTDALELRKTALTDGYRVERELGRSGVVTVHLAEDLKQHRHAATEVLRRSVNRVRHQHLTRP